MTIRDLSLDLLTELALSVTRPGFLVELGFDDPVRYSSMGDVTWNGETWISADVTVALSKIDGKGNAECGLTLGNTSQAIGGMILANGLAGRSVKVWVAYAGALDTADVVQVFEGTASDSQIGDDDVVIKAVVDSIKAQFSPRKRINRSTGFSVLLPRGTRLQIGSSIIILDR
jgi:hypothetical protein